MNLTIARILFSTAALVIFGLGTLHLLYTFYTGKFKPRNPQVELDMRATSTVLTKRTSMWNAWIGFNASHSLGAMFFGLINLILIWDNFPYFAHSLLLLSLDALTLLYYMYLARQYWFRIPMLGITISAICFLAATLLTWL